jgi:hypothetical protein
MKSLVDSDDRDVICVFPFLPRPKSMHRHDRKCNDLFCVNAAFVSQSNA